MVLNGIDVAVLVIAAGSASIASLSLAFVAVLALRKCRPEDVPATVHELAQMSRRDRLVVLNRKGRRNAK
jgi:hypothetical protein